MTVALSRGRANDLLHRAARWRPQRGWYRPKLTWTAPLIPFFLIGIGAFVGVQPPKIIGGLVAAVLIYQLSKRPAWCVLAALPFVTYQDIVLPLLWSYGLPGQIARQLGALKDVFVLALLIAAVREIRRSGRKLDAIDKLALGYVGYVLLQLFAPQLFDPFIPATFSTRLLAFRYDAGYVLLFLGVRHAPLPAHIRRLFVRMLFGVAAIMIAGGLWQKFALNNFTTYMFNTVRVVQYKLSVTHDQIPIIIQTYRPWLQRPIHVGSFAVLPQYCADILLITFAFVVERMVRAQRWKTGIVAFALLLFVLALTQVRANLLAAGALLLLVLLPRRGRTPFAKVGLVAMVAVGVVLVFPFVSGTRVTGGGNAQKSNKDHHSEWALSVTLMTNYPLGTGLGNNPATGDRFQLTDQQRGAFTGDNSWLQVGDELGVIAFILYTAMVVAIFAALYKRGRDDPFPNAALLAFTGLWIAGQFHHVFLSFPQAFAMWTALGLALPAWTPGSEGAVEGADPEYAVASQI